MQLLKYFLVVLFIIPHVVKAEEKWTSLFNGKDLTGWKIYGVEKWEVRDGAIVGETIYGKYGYLATQKKYRDFFLQLRFKAEGGGNSGVFFRSTMRGENFPGLIEGTQVEVDVDPANHTGGLYENPERQWLIWPTSECEEALDSDGWNDLRLEAVGNRINTYLNGVRCVEFTDPGQQHTDGVIALQIHSVAASQIKTGAVKVYWKDLQIKDLVSRE